jgi:hypothetical protein
MTVRLALQRGAIPTRVLGNDDTTWPWQRKWREVLELELGAGGGACNCAVGNANTDAEGRGVAVVDGGILAEVDARGSGVGYSGVVNR